MEIIDIKQDSLETEDILDIDTDDRDTNRKLSWSRTSAISGVW